MLKHLFKTPLFIAAALSSVSALTAHAADRPNVIIILADDMGYSDAGCYGGEIQTPVLDRLAANGLRFSQHYSTGRCWPSRSVVMTGYYAQQVGMDPRKGKEWPQWTRLVPHYLKDAGYRAYHSGKWHLRFSPVDPRNGFDHSYRTMDHDRFFSPKNHNLDGKPLGPVAKDAGYYTTTAIANKAVDFLDEHQKETPEKPFFLYLAFISPHFPLHALEKDIAVYKDAYKEGWDVIRERRFERMKKMGLVDGKLSERKPNIIAPWSMPEKEMQKRISPGESGHAVAWDELTEVQKDFQASKMAIHAAMIHRMDIEIGRVLEKVKTMGQYDNTVVFFISDNGASAEQIIRGEGHNPNASLGSAESYLCLGPGWSTAANAPLTLHKHWNHEGGISSPLIVHWPAGIKAKGELRHTPGHFIDLVPTILDITGVTPKTTWNGVAPPTFPGRSLRPAFTRDLPGERILYFSHVGNRAIRSGDWKAVKRVGKDTSWELYNIARDRTETTNLAKRESARLKRLTDQWEALSKQHEADRTKKK